MAKPVRALKDTVPLMQPYCKTLKMPKIGLGTWKSEPGVVGEAVTNAIKVGYRHIDCAAIYGNEKEIGTALQQTLKNGVVKREELFITSKVFNHMHGNKVKAAFEKTLSDLQLNNTYLDLYLMHWPVKFHNKEVPQPLRLPNGFPNPEIKAEFEYLDTWKEMESLLQTGKVKAIGVSNFTIAQLEDLSKKSKFIPAVQQMEYHPLLTQKDLVSYCKSKGIVITAYSPLGSPDSYFGKLPNSPSLLKNELVAEVAKKHKKSPAQILLRWAVQQDIAVIPKSVNPVRIAENFNIFDFELSQKEMESIHGLNKDFRYGMGWLPGHYLPS